MRKVVMRIIQLDIRLAGLLPKGDTLPPRRCSRRPVATLLWCTPWQSKRPSSIHFVQSRYCDNLLSSLFIYSVLIILGITCRMVMLGHTRRTAILMDLMAVGLNAKSLRRPPMVSTVVLPTMVPRADMLGLITIADSGIRTYMCGMQTPWPPRGQL